ncbi:MAG: hypothetical protein ACI9RM_002915, partial [Ulvibacter sp.]
MINIKKLLKKIPFVKSIVARRGDNMVQHLKKEGSLLEDANLQTRQGMIAHLKKGESLLENADQKTRDHWKPRIALVQESSDNGKINYVSNAGTFNEDDNLVMHNGLL